MAASASFASVVPSSELEAQSAPVVAASPAVTGLPAPWTINSIGSGMVSGSTSYSAGTASQSGSGTLGSTSDKLNFSYQTLSGDGQITAKISVLQNTGTLSGVGVMIRETLATNSKHVFMGMSGTNTYRTASRTTTGGIATSVNNGTGTVPNTWVKLVRLGNVITASRSSDGVTWILVGNTAVTMATNCYIGLAVSSGSDTILNTSKFSNFSITR
jgi:regulation of enolase protein 1 (concanavalin A-like superfamily)